MAVPNSSPAGVPSKPIGLDVWLERVLERVERVQPSWEADDVHDLRVALRRCRTMADALNEVNPGPGWHRLKKASRDLFRILGDLRDTQVERAWVKKLGASSDPVRKRMLTVLSRQEKKHRESAEQSLENFGRKDWKKLARKLESKARFFPLESVVFQRLALQRLNRAVELYRQARKSRSSAAWHRLRIGVKSFRYVVENFLPQRYDVWAEDLKRIQDQLGDVHDLDVLRSEVRRLALQLGPAAAARWLEKIEAERKARLGELIARTAGPDSPFVVWRAGFQWGHALVAAPFPQRRTA